MTPEQGVTQVGQVHTVAQTPDPGKTVVYSFLLGDLTRAVN